MHPHWHETSKEEQTVPVHSTNEQSSNESQLSSGIPVSRKPAAVLGMLIVSSLAFTYYHESSIIMGQVSDSSPIIHITENGVDPESVTVHQGQTITWINEQAIPHILESLDLCNPDGDCLYTPTVFPGEQINFEISDDIASGTYTYSSVISETVNGEIIVAEGVATLPTSESQEPADELPPDKLPPTPPLLPTAPLTPPSDTSDPPVADEPIDILSNTPETFTTTPPTTPPTQLPVPKANIPTNPNIDRNLSLNTNVIGKSNQISSPPPINSVHKPFSQPETGASSWIVFALSIIGLTWITRRTFAKA
ncbi:hypothetical protein KKF55_01135 [Patescibacteria group bacterium]|nr:hypothetical protein [Patescibacteria group bacterium]